MLVAVVALAACSGRPPEVVNPAPNADDLVFTDVTDEWGLSQVRGNTITAADYDGDGLVDLFVARNAVHKTNTFGDEATQVDYLLRNTGSGFDDVTQSSGITVDDRGDTDRAFQTLVWGDVDNDGDLDAFTGIVHDRGAPDTWNDGVHLVMLNQGDGTFAPARSSDVLFDSNLAGATFVDYDRDGNLDLWLPSFYEQYGYLPGEQDRLLRGNGDGTFDDVTEDVGLLMAEGNQANIAQGIASRPSYGSTACDVDDDGDADLLTSVYGRQWNQQWSNDDGMFTDIARETGFAGDGAAEFDDNHFYRCYCSVNSCPTDPGPPALGDCDTYASYWSPGWDDMPHRLNGNTFTTACTDVDNDGAMDLLNAEIVHWHIGNSSDPSQILFGNGDGTWSRPGNDATGLVRERDGAWNEGDIHVSAMDFDNDGWKDIFLSSSDYDGNFARLFRQSAPGEFEDVSENAEIMHPRNVGVALADFDNDGDLDVIVGSSTMRGGPWEQREVRAYRNDLDSGNSAFIRLAGDTANKAGIGAKVTVEAGGLEQAFEVSGGYGHRGMQHTTGLFVGLGSAGVIDRITVRWPDADNTTDVYENVRGNYSLVLEQGGKVVYDQ